MTVLKSLFSISAFTVCLIQGTLLSTAHAASNNTPIPTIARPVSSDLSASSSAHSTVIELSASHVPMLSKPRQFAKAIDDAAISFK